MRLVLFILITLALAMTGCSFSNSSGSFSDSSGSISDSISSPSKSSSESSDGDDSGSDEKETAPPPEEPEDTASYQRDVSQLTVTYLKSGGDLSAFQSGIANLAKARGITNWEADSTTTRAIGTGAGTAELDEEAFERFSKQLVGDDLMKLNELRIGYQESAPSTPPTAGGADVSTPPAAEATEAS